ncbi:MAG: tetratricopeptide repeat protein [Chitinispirillales bacterium]|nr:tetratricopeptide repeat protein [Chitinispirillales bacterium]
MSKAGRKSVSAMAVTVLTAFILILVSASSVRADAEFDNLFSAKKYKEALAYAEEKLPYNKRDPQLWIKVGQANEALGLLEKALACYLVAWRTMSDDYQALISVARIYNKMEQPEDAAAMAERALKVNFTAEASWEYARACILLKRPADAKKALEKIIATDSANVIANRELGNIYYNLGEFANAIPLMKRSYKERADGEVAFRIGRSYVEAGVPDSALIYLKIAVDRKSNVSAASRFIARARFGQKKYAEVVSGYAGVSQDIMDAMDFYMLGFAKEKTSDAAGASVAYKSAVAMFGNDKRKEALLARANLARSQLKSKAVSFAFPHLQFIVAADEKGAVVKDIYFLLADAYVESKDNPKAIASLEKAISVNSKNLEAYARLAELYEKNGQSDKAKKIYEQMVALSPNDPKVFVTLGNYSLKSKKWKEAVELFEKANKLKETADAFEGIAVAYYSAGDMNKAAMDAARSAITLNPDALEARAVVTRVLMSDKNYKAAQEHAEFLSKKAPNNIEYLRMLAECCDKNGAKAILAVVDKQIVAIDRKDVVSRLRLAAAAESKNDFKTAMSMYTDVTTLDPKNPQAHRRLAAIFAAQNQNLEAVASIREYLKLKPNDAEANRDLGDYLYNQKDLDGALNAYRTAIKLDPNLKGFHKRYAEIVIAKGQTTEVVTALTAIIKNGDADVGTYTTLGMIYQNRSQYKEAMEMYTKAAGLEPSNVDVLTALAGCQAALGDVKAAIISYEQVVMMNAGAAQEYKELADLYVKQKNSEEALRCYIKYLDKVPSDKATAANVGKLLYEQKKYADAAKYLSLAQATEPAVVLMYADACLRTGDSKSAQTALEDLRNRKPRVSEIGRVLALLGEMYEKDGKQNQAAAVYAEYAGLPGVKDRDASYKSAYLLEKSNPGAAMKIYEANMKTFSDDARNGLRLGLLYSQSKDTKERDKAVPLLQKSTAAANKEPKLWLEIAAVYGSMNRDVDELAAYQKYVRTDPQHVEANKRIGTLLMRKGDNTNAMISLEIANTMSPNDPSVMVLLAKGYTRTKRNKEAINMLQKAKALRPSDTDIRFQLYETYVAENKKQDAFAEIRELVKISNDTRYQQLFGDALVALGDVKEAEGVVDELLAKDPTDPSALMLRAKILRSRKEYDQALEVYKEIGDIQPDNALAHYERAETYVQASKPAWAETFYNRALRADPKFALAELGLAKLYKTRNQMDKYKEHLEAAQKLAPDNDLVAEEIKKSGK